MFEHDCLDTCCLGCLIIMCFGVGVVVLFCLYLHLFSAIETVSHGRRSRKTIISKCSSYEAESLKILCQSPERTHNKNGSMPENVLTKHLHAGKCSKSFSLSLDCMVGIACVYIDTMFAFYGYILFIFFSSLPIFTA